MLSDAELQELLRCSGTGARTTCSSSWTGSGQRGARAGSAQVITADGPGELRDKLRSDYAQVLTANRLAAPMQAEGGSL